MSGTVPGVDNLGGEVGGGVGVLGRRGGGGPEVGFAGSGSHGVGRGWVHATTTWAPRARWSWGEAVVGDGRKITVGVGVLIISRIKY
jgi:hypothetical protein